MLKQNLQLKDKNLWIKSHKDNKRLIVASMHSSVEKTA